MAEVRGLYSVIQLRDKLSAPLKRANATIDKTKTKLGKVDRSVAKLRTRFQGLTDTIKKHKLAFLALGVALTAVAYKGMRFIADATRELDTVFAYLEAQTGAVGDELNTLTESVRELARVNSDSFTAIGDSVSIVRRRFGDLGDDTTEVNQVFLDFAKINRMGVTPAVTGVTKIMKAYNIPARDAVKVSDLLIASQQGVYTESSKIIRGLGEQSVALRIWGLSLEESVGLLVAMEEAGLDTSRGLTALKSASDKFKTADEFWIYLEQLSLIENEAERTTVASEKFGATAGPAMAKMMSEGMDAMQSYILTEKEVAGATAKASAIIDEGLNEQLGILTSNLKLIGAEIGNVFLPVIKKFANMSIIVAKHLDSITRAIKIIGAVITFALSPFLILAAPFIAAILAIQHTWVKYSDGVRATLNGIANSVKGHFDNLKDIFFDAGANLIKAFVNGVKAFATAPINAIKEIGERIRAFLPFSDAEMGPLADITLSGRKLVETFGKGIASEMPMLGSLAKLMPAPAEMLSSSTTSIMNAPHSEDKRVSIGKIELHIDGVSNNAEEIGDMVIHRIKREFEKYGI